MAVSIPSEARHSTRVAVFGAGAIGCWYGGLLALAGYPVTLLARPARVRAIAAEGLRVQGPAIDSVVRIAASADPDALRDAELVLCCVKSSDTLAAADAMRARLRPDALVLSLQNGIENAQRLRAALPQHDVAAVLVYTANAMAGEAHVVCHGGGQLLLEASERAAAAQALLRSAGIAADLCDDIKREMWSKLIVNCVWNPLSALGRLPYAALAEVDDFDVLVRSILAECVAVAQADGVALSDDLENKVMRVPKVMGKQASSTAQDLARGRNTEIEDLNGYVVRRGRALGVPTPLNDALRILVHVLERAARCGRYPGGHTPQ